MTALFTLGTVMPVVAQDSVSAGGHWIRTENKDEKTGVASASFVLTGETEDYDRHPSFVLSCNGKQQPVLTYDTGTPLAGQAHDVYNHYAPSIWVLVKFDDGKIHRVLWDIIHDFEHGDKKAVVDRRTMHNLLTSKQLRLRFSDYQDESHLDQFVLGGLNIGDVRETCGAKWFSKAETKLMPQSSPSAPSAE